MPVVDPGTRSDLYAFRPNRSGGRCQSCAQKWTTARLDVRLLIALMKISAQSPCRVDLAGGTLDIWPLYLFHSGAVTVNFAVDRYTSCDLVTRDDSTIILRSADQQGE